MSLPTEKIDAEEALALLERAVSEKGEDYIDPNAQENGCMYFSVEAAESYGPCCIVGHVLHYKGVQIDDIEDINLDGSTSFLNEDTDVLSLNQELNIFSGLAEKVLYEAQAAQDAGRSWGIALERARAAMRARS